MAIEDIAERRYRLWSWNYGRSPQFNVQKSARFPAGKIDARIDVDEGRVDVYKRQRQRPRLERRVNNPQIGQIGQIKELTPRR